MSIFDINDKNVINSVNLMEDGWEYNGIKWILKIDKPVYKDHRKTMHRTEHLFVYENRMVLDITLFGFTSANNMKDVRDFIKERLDLTYSEWRLQNVELFTF